VGKGRFAPDLGLAAAPSPLAHPFRKRGTDEARKSAAIQEPWGPGDPLSGFAHV